MGESINRDLFEKHINDIINEFILHLGAGQDLERNIPSGESALPQGPPTRESSPGFRRGSLPLWRWK